jgi:flagella basal body P-ring formation protein FlgA
MAVRLPTVTAVNKALRSCAVACLLVGAALPRAPAQTASAALDEALATRVHALAREASQGAAPGLRVEVRLGRLDPRLKLAPCSQVQPYLPPGTRLWGAARIGLRCSDGRARWNVFLPLQVDVWGPGVVAAAPLVAGTTVGAADLRAAEVNLAARPHGSALTRAELAAGRVLARPLAAGEAVFAADLRARQWFAAGDTVRIVAAGRGWRIHGEGQALAPGLEGQPVRVRTDSGRIVSGVAVGEREVEVAL